MNRSYLKILVIVTSLGWLNSCYYNVEEELYPNMECGSGDISYVQEVLPIIQNNCYGCHDQSTRNGNVNLEGYTNLKIFVTNGKLVGAIKHENGFSPMPQGQPKLDDCSIAKIEKWVADGAENN